MGEALLYLIETELDSEWNEEVKSAWATVYNFLIDIMMSGYEKAKTGQHQDFVAAE